MNRIALLGSLVPLLALAAIARARDTVTWYQMDFPPIYILSGPHHDQQMHHGVDEAIQATLQAAGYEVVFRVANQERILHEMVSSGELVCCSALVRNTAMENQLEYTIPHSLALSGGVVVAKRNLERFRPFLRPDGRLALDALLKDSHFSLGIARSRNYTGIIDELLAAQPDSPHIFRRTGLDIGPGLIRMLLGGRIDYTLMFPWEAMYVARTLERESEIASLPVEGMPEYILGVGACPKTPAGKRVIELVNAAFRRFRNTPEYHRAKEYWLDENSKELYRKYVKEYFSAAGRAE